MTRFTQIRTSLLVALLLAGCGDSNKSTPPSTSEITSWQLVDGSAANGLNKDTASSAQSERFAYFNAKLYLAWVEPNATTHSQVRVAVFGGNDAAPAWSFVDGGGTTGLNKDATKDTTTPVFAQLGGKLYLAWSEVDGGVAQIRVAVYNGNDAAPAWSFVDGNGATGINHDATKPAAVPSLAVLGAKLYAIWYESDGTHYQIRAAVYGGNDAAPTWSFVDGNGTTGLNKSTSQTAWFPTSLTVNGKLYAAWMEFPGEYIHVAVYNGNDAAPAWSFVDGGTVSGLNKDATKDAMHVNLGAVGTKLYATWQEPNATKVQVRAAVYNGNDAAPAWSFVDGNGTAGLNKDTAQDAFLYYASALATVSGKLYVTTAESNGTQNQIRVAVYNGNDAAPAWSYVDGNGTNGINKDPTKGAQGSSLVAAGTKLYVTWEERNASNVAQARVALGQ